MATPAEDGSNLDPNPQHRMTIMCLPGLFGCAVVTAVALLGWPLPLTGSVGNNLFLLRFLGTGMILISSVAEPYFGRLRLQAFELPPTLGKILFCYLASKA